MSGSIPVVVPIDRFMAEANTMMRIQVATDLLRAQVVTKELHEDWCELIRQLSTLVVLGVMFPIFHYVLGPVIGIPITLGIGIPFEFATDG